MGKTKPKKGPGAKAAKRRKEQKRHSRSSRGKRQYPTKPDAVGALHQLKDETGAIGMAVYKCRVCTKWHVGHRPK